VPFFGRFHEKNGKQQAENGKEQKQWVYTDRLIRTWQIFELDFLKRASNRFHV
jgi:hypothetical protein